MSWHDRCDDVGFSSGVFGRIALSYRTNINVKSAAAIAGLHVHRFPAM